MQSSDGFLFSLKFPRLITHVRRLRGCERETDVFLGRAALLGDKLGVLLLQFPPSYAVKHMRDLDYLQKASKAASLCG